MTRYCGRDFTPEEFQQIRSLIKQNSEFNRMRLSKEVCRILQWLKPDGSLKDMSCRVSHPLAMHTGINTGLLVTGDEYIGKGRHGLTGDAVNLAARLTKLAQPGETLVGQDTYRHAEGYFIFEQLEPKRIKGKEESG